MMAAFLEVQLVSDSTQRSPAADALIRKEFLKADARNDNQAINDALYAYFDRELK
jgi:hypothetical protein